MKLKLNRYQYQSVRRACRRNAVLMERVRPMEEVFTKAPMLMIHNDQLAEEMMEAVNQFAGENTLARTVYRDYVDTRAGLNGM